MTAIINSFIYEKSVERQIHLLRHRAGFLNRIKKSITIIDDDFSDRIVGIISRLSRRDFSRLSRSTFNRTSALNNLFSELDKFRVICRQTLINDLKELNDLTKSEYDFNAELLLNAGDLESRIFEIKKISPAQAKEYRAQELSVNQTEKEAVYEWAARRKQKILQQIRKAASEGLQLEGILNSISGRNGILKATQFGATLAAETLHGAAVSAAGNAIIQENKDLDLDLIVLSIFDGKTSSKCYQKNGKRVFQDLNGVRPPFHMKCRTSVFPCIGEFKVDVETSTSWFFKQSEDMKMSILGKKRYEAYSEDKSSLKFPRDFINSNGDLYTLDELTSKGKLG